MADERTTEQILRDAKIRASKDRSAGRAMGREMARRQQTRKVAGKAGAPAKLGGSRGAVAKPLSRSGSGGITLRGGTRGAWKRDGKGRFA